MSKNLTWRLLALLIVLAVLVTACGGTAEPTAAPEPTEAGEAPAPTEEPAPSGEVQDFVTWYQYDQENEDPANDEAVGNAYIRETLPQFNEAFAGKWNWVNVPKAWDKMAAELVAAVQAGSTASGAATGRGSGFDEQLICTRTRARRCANSHGDAPSVGPLLLRHRP